MAFAKVTCTMPAGTRVRLSNVVVTDGDVADHSRFRQAREGVEISAPPTSTTVEIGHRGVLLHLLEHPTTLTVDDPQDVVDEGWASVAELTALGYDVS